LFIRNNDLVGRDWAAGELEWLESTGSPHLPENLKKAIRKDVEDGTWTSCVFSWQVIRGDLLIVWI
jgi:hypothetical protein